jgi:hypothetical protein
MMCKTWLEKPMEFRLFGPGFCASEAYISYVVPPLWIIALRRKSQGISFRWFSAEMLFCLAFLGLGVLTNEAWLW